MSEIPETLVEKAARAIANPPVGGDVHDTARAVLAAVLPDLPAARPVVDRGRPIPAVPEFAHISEDGSIVFPAGNCVRWLRANIDTLRVQDAADVRRAVAEQIAVDLDDCGYYPAATRIRYRLAHGTNGNLGPAAPTARKAGGTP